MVETVEVADNVSSRAHRPGEGPLSARQALIRGALLTCRDNPGGIWPCPLAACDILQAAETAGGRAYGNLMSALQILVVEGLFFEVQHGLFEEPAYYCSYDARFLPELPQGDSPNMSWNGLAVAMDDRFGPSTWRSLGLCSGQGRTDGWLGPCLGTACPQIKGSSQRCLHGLVFAEGLIVPCPGCGQDTVREDLVSLLSPIHFQNERTTYRPSVCEQCVDSRDALVRICSQESGQVVDWHRTLGGFEQALDQAID